MVTTTEPEALATPGAPATPATPGPPDGPGDLAASAGTGLTVRCQGVPDSARQRLISAGARITDDPEEEIAALVVSTRLAPTDLRGISDDLATRTGRTIVLAHTGAERLAADLIRAGADAIVGEGNEDALIGLVDVDQTPQALLASFERRFGGGTSGNVQGLDPATGLPDRRTFERRLGTIGDADEIPRVAWIKVASDRWNTADPDAVVAVQRRRLATTLAHLVTAAQSEIYATGNGEFGLVGPRLSPQEADRLGDRLVEAAATFRDRGLPLRIFMGHAGAESATEAEDLLDLARRAVEVAAVDGVRQVLGAEDLALGVSVTTELEALVRLLDELEPQLPEGRGHGERVGRLSAELARLRGCSPGVVSRTQLAGHLHDVGRAGLPPASIGGPDGLTGELLDAWQTFPIRSAELLQLTAGSAVAKAVRGQRERWNGEGFPDGLSGNEIPEPARMIAVAQVIDEELSAERSLHPAALASRLEERRGAELDPDLVATAIEHLDVLVTVRG